MEGRGGEAEEREARRGYNGVMEGGGRDEVAGRGGEWKGRGGKG